MEQLKEKYRRFKQWQEQPFEFKITSDEVHHCNNCGHDFTGNYCPACSQKAGTGRIGWRSVRQGVMDIWGLGSRSLLYSVWQLLWRPGHIISDYIDGKRQVSFPPVKMLFFLAVIFSMLYYWLLPYALDSMMEITHIDEAVVKDQMNAMDEVLNWQKNNYSWFALMMALFAVLPTWFMFRYSPRHTRHTLPEGFFIQVFMAVIMLTVCTLLIPLMMVDYLFHSFLSLFLFGVYYIIVYKHLFGYNLWGTLWRSGFVFLTVIFLASTLLSLAFGLDPNMFFDDVQMSASESTQTGFGYRLGFLASSVIPFVIGIVINYIVTGKARRELKQKSL